MKIKIVESGWAGYTGYFGAVEFKDGVSVGDVSQAEINNLSANIRIQTIEGDNVGVLKQYEESRNKPASAGATPTPAAEFVASLLAPTSYTREQLEEIADQKGIAGLRAIGEQFGVRAKSISDLIDGILEAQAPAADVKE